MGKKNGRVKEFGKRGTVKFFWIFISIWIGVLPLRAFSFSGNDLAIPYSDIYSDNSYHIGFLSLGRACLNIHQQESIRKIVRVTPSVALGVTPTKQKIDFPRELSMKKVDIDSIEIKDSFFWTGKYVLIRHRVWMPYVSWGYGALQGRQEYKIPQQELKVTESFKTENAFLWGCGFEMMLYQTNRTQLNCFLGYTRMEGEMKDAYLADYEDYIPQTVYQGHSETNLDKIKGKSKKVKFKSGSDFSYSHLNVGAHISYWYPIQDHSMMWTLGFDFGVLGWEIDLNYEKNDIQDPATPPIGETRASQDQRVERSISYRTHHIIRLFIGGQYDVRQDVVLNFGLFLLRENGFYFNLNQRF